MGGHKDKHKDRGSSKEDADRRHHLPRESHRHSDSSKESKEPSKDYTERRNVVIVEDPPRELFRDGHGICESSNASAGHVDSGSTPSLSERPIGNEAGGSPGKDVGPDVNNNDLDSHRFEELYAMMDTVVAKINRMDHSNKPGRVHTLSDSGDDDFEQDCFGDDNDPMDHLSDIFNTNKDLSLEDNDNSDFATALADFAGGFSAKEAKGEAIHDKYAAVLNDSLRNKPNDQVLKTVIQAVKLPANVPNLVVPQTNADITKAMAHNGKTLDNQLFRTNGLIARAMVPIATFVADIGQNKSKPAKEYLDGMNNAVRLLAAAFNYTNHTRKEVVRMNVKEKSLSQLCQWDSPVGQEDLFPFDVTKKCDELRKVRTLGSGPSNFKPKFQYRKPAPTADFKWPPKRYEHRPTAHPYAGKGKARAGKPFLGKRSSNDRPRKR